MQPPAHAPVLFLPGAGADPDFWKPLGERLPSAWPKRYLGWPGLGNQPADPTVNSVDDLVGRVEAEMGDGPVDLVAQSLGGVIALRLAVRHPAKIRRIVLAATSGGIDVGALGASDWRPDYRRTFPNAAPWILDPQPDLSADLSRVAQPTLLLWSDADPISPLAVGRTLWRELPHAMLHIVSGGDHSFACGRAGDIAALVVQHLE